MQRRSFLAALLGAPAMDSIDAVASGASVGIGLDNSAPEQISPLDVVLSKKRRAYERRREARERVVEHLPEHIASRKSWSGAFKVHVYALEKVKEPELWDMTNDELIAFFAKRGLGLSEDT